MLVGLNCVITIRDGETHLNLKLCLRMDVSNESVMKYSLPNI